MVALAGDAAGEGEWCKRLVEGDVSQRDLLAHFAETGAELESHLEDIFGTHFGEVLVFEGDFEPVEVGTELGEFLFISRQIFFLQFLELEMLEEVDFTLLFVVPLPESGFGDVQFFGDFGEAPAIGAEGHKRADFGGVMHNVGFLSNFWLRDVG